MTDNGVCAPKRQYGELKRYGAIGIFVLATAIILAAAWAAFSHYAGDLRDDDENELLAISDLKRAAIEAHVAERIADGRVVAQRTSTQAVLEASTAPAARKAAIATLSAALEQTRKAYGYRRIVLLDARLKPVVPAGEKELSESTTAAITAALALRDATLVDLVRNGPDEIVYGVVVPVFAQAGPSGAPIGAVYLELDAQRHLFPLVTLWPNPGDTAESVLYRKDGDNILALSPLRHAPAVAPLTQRLRADDLSLISSRTVEAAKGAVRGSLDYRRVPVIAAVAPINGTPWTLVSKIDQAEAESSISDLRNAITALVGIFVLLAGSLSYLAWKTQHQRSALRHAALTRELNTSIEILTEAFVRMDREARIIDANSALCTMTGYTLDELRNISLFDVEGTMNADEIREKFARIYDGNSARFQTKWKRKDGSLVDVDVSTVAVEGESGRFVVGFMRDITDLIANSRRLERANRYHALLTQLTQTVSTLRDPNDILGAVCRAATVDNHFALAWAGTIDYAAGQVSLVAAEGPAAGIARQLLTTRPDLPMLKGVIGEVISSQKAVIARRLPESARFAEWRDQILAFGILSAATAPVIVHGSVVATINLYATEDDYFDAGMVALLEETARTASIAWEAGLIAAKADAERVRREEVQTRYQRVFETSPLPKQLHSARNGKLLAINRAHERLFGYPAADLVDPDKWFDLAFPDVVFRGQIRARWQADIEKARATGLTMESPELNVRCKDGSDRVVRGFMTVSGEDLVISWVDLTQQRLGEKALLESESRYQGIFDASPVAIQIHSAADGRLVGINRAHVEKFGYTLAEYVDIDGWFEHAYPDPVFREKTRADFMHAIEATRSGGTFQSEELRIRCKDGSERIAMASVSRAGNDVIASWTDLTDARRSEQLLRESEKRFRGMVEQSISGFYVVQDGRIIYANKRLAEILGRQLDEVIGRDAIEFVAPEEREKVARGRKQLVEGVRTVSFEAGILRKDGERAVVGVTAAPGLWDDKPALVAIVEDITERTKSAEKLADYVKRLEVSMRGTLHAVARMVDLRDPYTAGHQRRVGIIAADIARELGWDEERAGTMELIGLVHDIGKISVPAELLSKPSRLTPTEFELIKGHAQASYDILKDVKFDVPVADIIVQHHERLNGSGYPKGLKGDEISPEGRLLAVADVLESMASHRPYRPALGIEAALAELDRNRDTFYDGGIVDTVKRMVHEKGYQLPQ